MTSLCAYIELRIYRTFVAGPLDFDIMRITVFNITVKDDSGGRRNTDTFTVTFSTPNIPKYITIGYIRVPVSVYIYQTHCAVLNAKNLVTKKCLQRRLVPRVVRLATPTVIVQVSLSAWTALAITLPSAKTAWNGYSKKGSSKWRQKGTLRVSKLVGLSVQTARAAQLRKAAQLLLWWPPRVAPHYQSLTWFMPICYASQLYDRHQKNYNVSRIKNITFGHVREKVSPLPTLSPLSDKNRSCSSPMASSNPRVYRPAGSMVRDFRGVQFYSPALPKAPST